MRLALDEELRRAIAVVLRSFEERSVLARKLAADARKQGHRISAHRWETEVQDIEQQANSLRESVKRIDDIVLDMEAGDPVSVVGPGA
jgi:hypothetical protein